MSESTHKGRANSDPKKIEQPKEQRDITQDYQKVLATEAGIRVFRDIMAECGYKLPSTVRQMTMTPDGKAVQIGDILPMSTTYNESKRDVWLTLRKKIKPNRLNLVEMELENDADE